jgi:single-strand DNA-binding protein
MNRIILIGNLGFDPEQKTFSNGGGLVKLRVATTEYWRDRQTQERRSSTDWHDVVVNGPQGDSCMKYLKKGSKVAVEGSMRSRKVPSQDGGPDRTFWEVRAQHVEFLDRREDRGYDEGNRDSGNGGNWPSAGGWDAQKGGGNSGGWDAQKGGGNSGGWDAQKGGGHSGGWSAQNGGGNSNWGTPSNGGGNPAGGNPTGGNGNWGGQSGGGWGTPGASTNAGSSAGWGNPDGNNSGDGGDGGQGMPF